MRFSRRRSSAASIFAFVSIVVFLAPTSSAEAGLRDRCLQIYRSLFSLAKKTETTPKISYENNLRELSPDVLRALDAIESEARSFVPDEILNRWIVSQKISQKSADIFLGRSLLLQNKNLRTEIAYRLERAIKEIETKNIDPQFYLDAQDSFYGLGFKGPLTGGIGFLKSIREKEPPLRLNGYQIADFYEVGVLRNKKHTFAEHLEVANEVKDYWQSLDEKKSSYSEMLFKFYEAVLVLDWRNQFLIKNGGDELSIFDQRFTDAYYAYANMKRNIEKNPKLIVELTARPVTYRDFVALAALPIVLLEIGDVVTMADGRWRSPFGLLEHDLAHWQSIWNSFWKRSAATQKTESQTDLDFYLDILSRVRLMKLILKDLKKEQRDLQETLILYLFHIFHEDVDTQSHLPIRQELLKRITDPYSDFIKRILDRLKDGDLELKEKSEDPPQERLHKAERWLIERLIKNSRDS